MSPTVAYNGSEAQNRLLDVAALVEASDVAIIGKTLKNIILSWNRGAERLYGYSALDIRMAGGDGLDALVALKREHPLMAVVMLTTYDNPTYMARAVAGGAAGYLLKGVERDEMLAALRAVMNGETLLSYQELVRSLRGISPTGAGEEDLIVPLTGREQEVLLLLATGLSNRDMAAVLFVAECTVKTHVEHIRDKLGVSDRVQAAVWAVRHGLGPPASD